MVVLCESVVWVCYSLCAFSCIGNEILRVTPKLELVLTTKIETKETGENKGEKKLK